MTQAEARRAILTRQGLVAPFETPHDAVRAMVAVQTQYAASLPVAVAARTRKPKLGWDDDALTHGGSLVKSWSVRNTLHAHLPEDFALIVGARGARAYERYRTWMRTNRRLEMDALEARMLEALAQGPLSRDQLHDRVPELRTIESVGWGLDVMGLAYRGRLCVVGRGTTQCFALLPDLTDSEPVHLGRLLRRYLEGYGPATLSDFSHWTGLPLEICRPALHEAGELVRVHVEGMKGERLDIPDAAPPTEEPLGVRLLAKFDPLVLSHKDKTLFIHERDRTRIFRIAAQVEAVVLSDGIACATWRLERKAKSATIRVEPFRPLKPREQGRLEKQAAAMGKKLGYGTVDLTIEPVP